MDCRRDINKQSERAIIAMMVSCKQVSCAEDAVQVRRRTHARSCYGPASDAEFLRSIADKTPGRDSDAAQRRRRQEPKSTSRATSLPRMRRRRPRPGPPEEVSSTPCCSGAARRTTTTWQSVQPAAASRPIDGKRKQARCCPSCLLAFFPAHATLLLLPS